MTRASLASGVRALCIGGAMALLTSAGIVFQVVDVHGRTRLEDMKPYRRFWGDMTVAILGYLDRRLPDEGLTPGDSEAPFRDVLIDRDGVRNLGLTRPFDVIPPRAFLGFRHLPDPRTFDDPGRARMLESGFRLVGGISPYLVFWLAPVAVFPALWFLFGALAADRQWSVASVLLVWLVATPYVAETLAMPRNPVGFYLVAVVTLVASAVRSLFGRPESGVALCVRALITGSFLAWLMASRSSVVFTLPGFLAALLIAGLVNRPARSEGLKRSAVAFVCLLLPIAAMREERHHDVWDPVWQGLGDFDRTYDHTWSDRVAEALVVSKGAPRLASEISEGIFREKVLEHITSDPAWYAEILLKRAASTATLWKLWPYGPVDGEIIRRSTSPNEGSIDKYFTYTATVDLIGRGARPVEVRIAFVLLPLALYLAGAMRPGSSWDRRGLILLGCVALGVFALPVLMTTAGGQETQCAVFLHVLGAGLLMKEMLRVLRSRGSEPRSEPRTGA